MWLFWGPESTHRRLQACRFYRKASTGCREKIIVSCRDASSYVEEAFKVSFELNINNKLWAVPCFCCRGVGLGWDDFG